MIHLRLLRLLTSVKWGIVLLVVIGLASNASIVVQAVAMAFIFSGIVTRESLSTLQLPLIFFIAALLVRPVLTILRELCAHAVASRMKEDLRARLLWADARRGPFAMDSQRSGAQQALLVDGIENLEPYATRYIPQIFLTFITSATAVVLLAAVDVVVAVVSALLAATAPLLPRLWEKVMARHGQDHWDAYSSLQADVMESMRGMETLKLLGAAGRRREELDRANTRLLTSTLSQLKWSLAESGLNAFLLVLGPAAALTAALLRVHAGVLEPPALFFVALVSFEVFRPFRDLANYWHAGFMGVNAGNVLMAQFAHVPEPPTTQNNRATVSDSGPAVTFRNVSAAYPGSEGDALHGCDLTIPRGSFTLVVGPSGCGKSTIANVIVGLLPVRDGDVAITCAPSQAGRAPVSLVSQEPVIFTGTVGENLRLVAPQATPEELRAALEQAHCRELIAPARGGFDAEVGDAGGLLSGGQRQRLAIARGILRGSPILILDEASSALEAEKEREVLDSVRPSAEDERTLIMIAHRLTCAPAADQILVIDGGRVVETGTFAELMDADGLFAQMYRTQNEGVTQ